MPKAAWIGLGAMGYPMAAYLAKHSDINLTVYNRTTSKAKDWLEGNRGSLALTPQGAAEGAELVFSCVGNDDDLKEVTSGREGAFHSMQPGGIFIDHSTISATMARGQADAAKALGLQFLDAPVTGGQKGAENGTLSIMVGGESPALEKAGPFMETYAKAITHMGPSGRGQQAKMANQIAIAGLVQGLAEAINFAKVCGLDIERLLTVTTKGAAQSWQMVNSGKSMAEGEFNHGFAVDWMRKDLGICLEEAARHGISLPVTKIVESYFEELQTMKAGRLDITSLIKRLESEKMKNKDKARVK